MFDTSPYTGASLPWHTRAVIWVDWLSHEVVTPTFAGLVLLAACGAIWVACRTPLPSGMLCVGPADARPLPSLTVAEAEGLLRQARQLLKEGNDPRSTAALRACMAVIRRAGDAVMQHQSFLDAAHLAAGIYHARGDPASALKLLQAEKFCYEAHLMPYASVGGGSGGCATPAPPGPCGATSTLSEQRCRHFCLLSRLFLENKNDTMALDYAIKAFALREKIRARGAEGSGNYTPCSVKDALACTTSDSQEHASLLAAYSAAAAGHVGTLV